MDGECSKPAEKDEIPMGMAGDGKTMYGRNKKRRNGGIDESGVS